MKQTKLQQQYELLDNFSVDDLCSSNGCNKCRFNDVKATVKIQELLEAKEAAVRAELVECPSCTGDGFIAGHDPNDPHENGCNNCPIQLQCELCEGTGEADNNKMMVFVRSIRNIKEPNDDLPF